MRKITAQCIECVEKCHLDRACKRQRDGGKHESVATGPTMATPDKDYCSALTQWKKAHMLVENSYIDHIMAKTDTFLDFVSIQPAVGKTNAEDSRVVDRGCVRNRILSNI